MKEELKQFYYKILNLAPKVVNKEYIEKIVTKEMTDIEKVVNEKDGLCKVVANNLRVAFKEENIRHVVVDLRPIVDVDHVIILCYIVTDENVVTYLVDPTFQQFLPKTRGKNIEHFIGIKLWRSGGEKTVNDLCISGVTEINNESFNTYLNSFNYDKHRFIKLEELVLDQELKKEIK